MSGTVRGGRLTALRMAGIGAGLAALALLAASTAAPVGAQDPSPSLAVASGAPMSPAPASPAATGDTIAVTLADFMVTPMVIDATGPTVTFDVRNDGPTPHNFTVRDASGTVLGGTSTLSTGGTAQLTLTFPGPGTYITFCTLPGHESLGLKGELVVTDGPAGPVASPTTASPGASPAA